MDEMNRYLNWQLDLLAKVSNCALEFKYAAKAVELKQNWKLAFDIDSGLDEATRRMRAAEEALTKAQNTYWTSTFAEFVNASLQAAT